ncbi:hypothetical protein BOX15_Mlig017500g3, partial [Macrostomum lignano]
HINQVPVVSMYFLSGWPQLLTNCIGYSWKNRLLSHQFLQTFDEHPHLVLFASDYSFYIYNVRTCIQLCSYNRSQESVNHYGETQLVLLSQTNTILAASTTLGYILILTVDLGDGDSSVLVSDMDVRQGRTGKSAPGRQPLVSLRLSDAIHLGSQVTSMCHFKDDLIVATKDGLIRRLRWNGGASQSVIVSEKQNQQQQQNQHQSVDLRQVTFFYDLEHSRATRLAEEGLHCRHLEFSPSLGVFVLLLSNGKAALLATNSATKLDQKLVEGILAENLKYATCMSVNNKYRTVAFGGRGTDVVIFTADDDTGAFAMSNRFRLTPKHHPPGLGLAAGQQTQLLALRWTPDCAVLLGLWDRGHIALWTAGGFLLLSIPAPASPAAGLIDACWCCSGYLMATITERGGLSLYSFVKSGLVDNPCQGNLRHIVQCGPDRVFLSPHHPHTSGAEPAQLYGGSKNWHTACLPALYTAAHWPIRHVSIDEGGRYLAVAGSRGFLHYAIATRKWKLFGNETQERSFTVQGGLVWWGADYICMSDVSLESGRAELRVYPRQSRLDNAQACIHRLAQHVRQPQLVNLLGNQLVLLSANCQLDMFALSESDGQAKLSHVQELSLSSYMLDAGCVLQICLTNLRSEIGGAFPSASGGGGGVSASFDSADLAGRSRHQSGGQQHPESVLVNYSGRLYFFQRDRGGLMPVTAATAAAYEQHQLASSAVIGSPVARPLPFCSPMVIATNVEIVWTPPHRPKTPAQRQRHVTDSIWLNCGSQGMRVWLPLVSSNRESKGYLSKRIMLPFCVEIYPLVVLFEEVLFLSCINEVSQSIGLTLSQGRVSGPSDNISPLALMPFNVIEKTSQIFLNHIVKQLLRKNLGHHALHIAKSSAHLTYFNHCLELLLHEVLEEEATSKEPVPDPLLPRVVAFVQEFPAQYLDTVARCARKTEVSLWPYLFANVGSPKDLFEVSLVNGQLKTAASYLLILENTEKPIVSKQHATLLLDAALDREDWNLARDLIRFLKSIDPAELADTATAAAPAPQTKRHHAGAMRYPSGPLKSGSSSIAGQDAADTFAARRSGTQRDGSAGKSAAAAASVAAASITTSTTSGASSAAGTSSAGVNAELTVLAAAGTTGGSGIASPAGSTASAGAGGFSAGSLASGLPNLSDEVNGILLRHARNLLGHYRVHELARFAANIEFENNQFVAWLRRERLGPGRVTDFVSALKKLHLDFKWPLPIRPTAANSSGGNNGSGGAEISEAHLLLPAHPAPPSVASPSQPPLAAPLARRPQQQQQQQHQPDKQVFLKPRFVPADDTPSTAATAVGGDLSSDGRNSATQSTAESLAEEQLDQLTAELANTGPPGMAARLRWLLKVFNEACCLDWALLVAAVLRDTAAAEAALSSPTDSVTAERLREGLLLLTLWSESECPGYRGFFADLRARQQLMLVRRRLKSDSSAGGRTGKPGDDASGATAAAATPAASSAAPASSSTAATMIDYSINRSSSAGALMRRKHTSSGGGDDVKQQQQQQQQQQTSLTNGSLASAAAAAVSAPTSPVLSDTPATPAAAAVGAPTPLPPSGCRQHQQFDFPAAGAADLAGKQQLSLPDSDSPDQPESALVNPVEPTSQSEGACAIS